MDTENLVKQLEGGDREPLAELFSRYRDKLGRLVAFRLDPRLRGRISPSDVLQDAFLDAAARIEHFLERRATMSVFVWLRLIVIQRLMMLHRRHLDAQRRDARRDVPLEAQCEPGAPVVCLAAHLADSLTTPSQALQRAELLAGLEEGLRALDPIDCEILALRHFEELTNNEAAEVLGLSKAAASNRYVRALGRLRSILDTLPAFADDDSRS